MADLKQVDFLKKLAIKQNLIFRNRPNQLTLFFRSPPDTCMTVPGRLVTQAGNGQKLLLVSAATTPTSASRTAADCCTKQRDVMRLLVNAIGLRNGTT